MNGTTSFGILTSYATLLFNRRIIYAHFILPIAFKNIRRPFYTSLPSLSAHKPTSSIYKNNKAELESLVDNPAFTSSICKSVKKSRAVDNKLKACENILFKEIEAILASQGFNVNTQRSIEELIFTYMDKISMNPKSLVSYLAAFDSSIFTNKLFIEFLFDKIDLFTVYVDKLKGSKAYISNKRSKNLDGLLNKIFFVLDKNDFISPTISCLLRCITFYNISDKKKTNFYLNTEISLSIEIGKDIVNKFVRVLYKNANMAGMYRLAEFRKALFLKDEFKSIDFDNDEVFAFIGLKLLNIMYEVDLLSSTLKTFGDKQQNYMVGLSENLSVLLNKKILNKPIHISMNLPMIVEPKDYVCTTDKDLVIKSGGYYLNNELFTQPLVNYNFEQPYNPKVSSSMIIDSLNNMMKIPFKINTDSLDFILDNHKLLLKDANHPLMDKKDRSKREEKELQSYTSEKILEEYILMIANIYRNAPSIYFPLMLDFRGRIYNKVTYLNYQGSELAKALILFARPCYIYRNNTTAIEYLKAYAANCYGNGLDKKSYKKRLD